MSSRIKCGGDSLSSAHKLPYTVSMIIRTLIISILFLLSAAAFADQTSAYCKIYSPDNKTLVASAVCRFSQYQGHVYITLPDKKTISLTPQGNTPGIYLDKDGNNAYRKKGLGKKGQIYQLKQQVVYVYWDSTNAPKIVTKPLDYHNVRIMIDGDGINFKGVMQRQAGDLFMASDNAYMVKLHANTGQVIILEKATDKLKFNLHTTPITTFENPDTMCDKNSEPC